MKNFEKNPMMMSECPIIIKDFLGYMQTIKGKSPRTINEYYIDLRTFFRYMKFSKQLIDRDISFNEIDISDMTIDIVKEITLTNIYEYLNYVLAERKNNPATRSRKVSSLRSFFKYLTNKTGQLKDDPTKELDSPKLKSSLPKFLTLEESLELLNSVDGNYKERDYCILTLFLNCGMRLSELVSLNTRDIRSDGAIKLTGKGNKERIVYLNDACRMALDKYLQVRPVEGLQDKNALFISRLKRRISPKTVQFLVNKYLKAIGLDGQGYSVHKLRHTAATLMYQHGNVDIRILKDILGHENLGTTEIYTHVSSAQMKQAAASNPLAKVKSKKNTLTDN